MNNALRIRKILGGGMRQAGYLANAGLYALDNNIERLSEDHKKAKEIGEVLKKSKFVKSVEKIETNIVINTGVLVFQPKKHKDFLLSVYNKYIQTKKVWQKPDFLCTF